MRILVVSTYGGPKQNIGDYLITKSTIGLLRELFGDQVETVVCFRGDDLASVLNESQSVDFVLFACLAIRKNLRRYYPGLAALLEQDIPFGVLSAGTAIKTSGSAFSMEDAFTHRDIEDLIQLSRQARFFTTRDVLSHGICQRVGMERLEMTGDVAYLDSRFDGRRFKSDSAVDRIAISDPHNAPKYKDALAALIDRMKRISSGPKISLLVHGVNPAAEEVANSEGIEIREIYKDPESGLEIYDEFDMHVGFRVHGHVSALSRRIPSYLLEQDGRGCGYGMTLDRKISVSCPNPGTADAASQADTLPVDLLTTMIVHDIQSNFSRFNGLEEQLLQFGAKIGRVVERLKLD